MVCKDLVGGIAADKVEEGEGAAWVSVEPGDGNAEEDVVEDDEELPGTDAPSDVLAREHGILM